VSRPGERATKVVTERRPAEYPSRGKAQKGRIATRSKAQEDPGGAGYEIAKECIACPVCAQEYLAKEAAEEAESLGI
jgi:formate hydrogenlyase subunit 6/NADH:ubiquinone oxidoreductase subunit I